MLEKIDNDTDPALYESAYIFDALWTAALALNRTETRLNEENLTLLNFTYDDVHNISDIIYEEALNVSFFGLTVSHRSIATKMHIYNACSYVHTDTYIYTGVKITFQK